MHIYVYVHINIDMYKDYRTRFRLYVLFSLSFLFVSVWTSLPYQPSKINWCEAKYISKWKTPQLTLILTLTYTTQAAVAVALCKCSASPFFCKRIKLIIGDCKFILLYLTTSEIIFIFNFGFFWYNLNLSELLTEDNVFVKVTPIWVSDRALYTVQIWQFNTCTFFLRLPYSICGGCRADAFSRRLVGTVIDTLFWLSLRCSIFWQHLLCCTICSRARQTGRLTFVWICLQITM